MTEWSSQTIRKCLEALKKLPDFDKYPLPENIYKEFNIPMSDAITSFLAEYLDSHKKARSKGELYPVEVRQNDGIVRTLLEAPVRETIVEPTLEELKGLDVPSPTSTGKPYSASD